MENRLLTRDRMDRMIDAADDGEARKVLAECGYPEGGGLDQALAAARADVFRDMESAVPDRRLVEIFQLKYDYHNAKILLKAAGHGAGPEPAAAARRTIRPRRAGGGLAPGGAPGLLPRLPTGPGPGQGGAGGQP